MSNGIRWFGLDVHAAQTTCAVFDSATGELFTRRVMGRPHEGGLVGASRAASARSMRPGEL